MQTAAGPQQVGGWSNTAAYSKPGGATAATGAGTTSFPSRSHAPRAVLGSDVAGYTSAITRSPISPSGYAVPVSPGNASQQRQEQHQLLSPSSSRHMQMQQQQQQVAAISKAAAYGPSSTSPNIAQPLSGAPAAAAAAALAALAGSYARIGSAPTSSAPAAAPAAAAGGYTQQYAASKYAPPAAAGSTSGSRGSMLLWNVKQPSPAATQPSTAGALAGRRAVTASSATGPDQLGSSSGSTYMPSGSAPHNIIGSRSSSQESGLQKLKQLSTARLVRRLGTPPDTAAVQRIGNVAAAAGALSSTWPAAPGGSGARLPQTATVASSSRTAAPQQGCMQVQQQLQGPTVPRQQQQATKQHTPCSVVATASSNLQDSSLGSHTWNNGSSQLDRAKPTSSRAGRQPGPLGLHQQQSGPEEGEFVDIARQQCASCGRCFAPAALQQHMRICDKVFNQKRKVFDTKSQRLAGTGAAVVSSRQRQTNSAGSSSGKRGPQQGASHSNRPAVSAAQAKKSKWQLQSEQLRAAMRAAHPQAGGGTGVSGWGGGAAQVEEVEDTRVQCPHCGRRFAELVAERHIPKCADIIAKPTTLKAAGGRSAYMRNNSKGSH